MSARQVERAREFAPDAVGAKIMAAYEEGRNTSFSNKEIKHLVRRFMPELFDSEFDQMKRIAGELASNLVERLARDGELGDAVREQVALIGDI